MNLLGAPAFVDPFRNQKEGEEHDGKEDAADCGNLFRDHVNARDREQHQGNNREADWNLRVAKS